MNAITIFLLTIYSSLAFSRSIELWHTLSIQEANIIETAVRKIESKHQVKININTLFDAQMHLIQAAHYKVLPDIVIGPGDLIGLWNIADFSPIPNKLIKEIKTESSNLQKNYHIKKNSFGIPLMGGNFLMLYYNKKYVSKPITDFNDLFNLKFSNNVKPIIWDASEPFYVIPFLEAFQVRFFNNNNLLNSNVFSKAIKEYKAITKKLNFDKNCFYRCVVDNFINGQVAYMINGDWVLDEVHQKLGKNWGAVPLPMVNNRKMKSIHFGKGIFFPNNSFKRNKVVFSNLIRELHSTPIQKKLTKKIPSNAKKAFNNTGPLKIVDHMAKMTYLWPVLAKTLNIYFNTDIPLSTIVKRNEQLLKILVKRKNSGKIL